MLSSFSDKISADRMLMTYEFRISSQKNENNIITITHNADQIFGLRTAKYSKNAYFEEKYIFE
jgi:hypothetical protein